MYAVGVGPAYVSKHVDSSWSKGGTQYSDITSTNKVAYPSNGREGGYWYVYKGIK